MRTYLGFFFGLFSSLAVAASDSQTWAGIFAEHPLGQHWIGFGEVQNRLSRDSSKERQLLARVAAGYQITKTHSVWLGYGWTPSFDPGYLDEHRLWQQSLARYVWDSWNLSFRFRLEERFLAGGLAWQWREQVRVALKLTDGVDAVLWDEFFFNFNRTASVTVKGFAQNRLFLGPRISLSPEWAIEPGYMNVIQRPSDTFHVGAVYVFYRGSSEAGGVDGARGVTD